MGLEDRKEDLKKMLAEIRELLKEIAPARARRRANGLQDEREKTEDRKTDLLKLQEDALDDLERAERQLERLQEDDEDPAGPRGSEAESTEMALVAEIDLLEREIDRRDPKIQALRRKDQRQTERYRKLDAKADRRKQRAAKIERRKKRALDRLDEVKDKLADRPEWPSSLNVAELLYHSPPHCHLASPERSKLIEIGKLAQAFGLRVGEFPPFDLTEPVHTGTSWHYRDPSRPFVGIAYNAAMMRLGGPWGCAMDLNDADGGSDKEIAFYHELVRRYG